MFTVLSVAAVGWRRQGWWKAWASFRVKDTHWWDCHWQTSNDCETYSWTDERHQTLLWCFEEKSLYSLFGMWFRDWCVLQNIKCVKVMFVWSVFKELEKCSKSVGALNPVNYKGSHQGWTQTSLYLKVTAFTSHRTTSHDFLGPIYIPRALNTGTCIRLGDLLYSAGLHRKTMC